MFFGLTRLVAAHLKFVEMEGTHSLILIPETVVFSMGSYLDPSTPPSTLKFHKLFIWVWLGLTHTAIQSLL